MTLRRGPARSVPFAAVVAILASCTGSSDNMADTTIAETTTTQVATAAAAPEVGSSSEDGHAYSYQSVGYSCGPDPAAGCGGDTDMALVEVWVGSEHDPIDFIDFYTEPQDDAHDPNADLLHEAGEADSDAFAKSGWGLRVLQLESPPEGLDVGGSAWLELTVSSVSASEFSTREPKPSSASTGIVSKHKAPTGSEPTVVDPPPYRTHLIEEMVLAATTSDMMQWIVVLRHPGTYHYAAGYYLSGPRGSGNGLQILVQQN